MLGDVIMFSFTMFLIFLFTIFAVTGMAMFNQWAMVQHQAQFVASSVAKWGQVTSEVEQSITSFANDLKIPRNRVKVTTSGGGPYGQGVTAEVTIPFEFKVGKYRVGTYDLTGKGRAVSVYIPGGYDL